MNRQIMMTLTLAALTAAGTATLAGAQSFSVQTIMSGLSNPRGLAFAPDGSLYVTEAGVGGFGPSFEDGAGVTVSYGETGGLSRWLNGSQTRLINNLPSVADRANGAPGGGSGGLTGITFAPNGTAYGVINFGGEFDQRGGLIAAGATKAAQLGTVVQFDFGTNSFTSVADITAYAKANNLQGPTQTGRPESNPYGLTALKGGGVAVVDAGGNFVAITNSANQVISHVKLPNYPNLTFNPNNPATGGPTYQAVPTSIVEGPDGTLYVSELGGYPFTVGGEHITMIKNGVITGRLNGFTNLMDVEYLEGNLYALQLDTNGLTGARGPGPGQLLKINPLTGVSTLLYNGLSFPGGLAIGADHAFYVTNNSVAPGFGSVIRIQEVPEPGTFALVFGMLGGAAFVLRRRK